MEGRYPGHVLSLTQTLHSLTCQMRTTIFESTNAHLEFRCVRVLVCVCLHVCVHVCVVVQWQLSRWVNCEFVTLPPYTVYFNGNYADGQLYSKYKKKDCVYSISFPCTPLIYTVSGWFCASMCVQTPVSVYLFACMHVFVRIPCIRMPVCDLSVRLAYRLPLPAAAQMAAKSFLPSRGLSSLQQQQERRWREEEDYHAYISCIVAYP